MGALRGALRIEDIYPRYSYEDYKHWEGQWELIDGIAYAMAAPMPSLKHQKITNKIGRQLDEIFEECKKCQVLQPVDWKIDEHTVVQPDNLVICHTPTNENYLTKAPEIVFEVLSKSTAKKDLSIKYELYEKECVKFYIIVNPDDEVAKVYQLRDGRYIKVGDFSDEVFTFNINKCNKTLNFDFSKIWE